jgi:hypothetical protein
MDPRIAALKEGLALIDAAIAQTESTLRLATTQADIAGLQSRLIELRSERQRGQALLDALESASEVVQPLGAGAGLEMVAAPAAGAPVPKPMSAAKVKALRKDVATAHAAAPVVKATLAFADDVVKLARALRGRPRTMTVGDNPTVPTGRPRPRKKRG